MRLMHIYKSNKYRSMVCRISQKPRNDRKIKTVKYLFFVKYSSFGLFRKGKPLIAKFYRTDFIICSHSIERKTPSYSQIHTVLKVL